MGKLFYSSKENSMEFHQILKTGTGNIVQIIKSELCRKCKVFILIYLMQHINIYIYISYINTSEEGNLKTCLSKELKSMFSLVSNPRIYWFCIEEMLS